MEQYRLDDCGNEIDPHNPWPVGCDWWYRANEAYSRAKDRREYRKDMWREEQQS